MGKDSQKTVERQILTASYVSIIGNGLLSVAKIVTGVISGSSAVVGDGIDSASDVAGGGVWVRGGTGVWACAPPPKV